MLTHEDLRSIQAKSLKMQAWIRQETFSPESEKTLRRFPSWEVAEYILGVKPTTLRWARSTDPALPAGYVEPAGRQRWFTLEEVNTLRRKLKHRSRSTLTPPRPRGRAIRTAVANFKGGAGKSTVVLHFAHAAALDGYRVLCVDFDPQATLSHAMGRTDVVEDYTVWGIMARDFILQTEAQNSMSRGAASGTSLPRRAIPSSLVESGLETLRVSDFIVGTNWPTIDIIPSCANAAFVEFASASYRAANPDWSFFAAVSRFLAQIPDDEYDIILFDCPPAIGYQSMTAVFAADILWIPSGPGYWEYDSTTSFLGQLSDALSALGDGLVGSAIAVDPELPKTFREVRFLLTRYEPSNSLHQAMFTSFKRVFGERMTENPITMTRAVEQSGRFLNSVYEMDYREMTKETWLRARDSFETAYREYREIMLPHWEAVADEASPAGYAAAGGE